MEILSNWVHNLWRLCREQLKTSQEFVVLWGLLLRLRKLYLCRSVLSECFIGTYKLILIVTYKHMDESKIRLYYSFASRTACIHGRLSPSGTVSGKVAKTNCSKNKSVFSTKRSV